MSFFQTLIGVLAAIDLAHCLLVARNLIVGGRQLANLRDVEPLERPLPSLSIVVAARNEASNIEPALRSLLKLDYEPLELVVVDDRSTDETGAILDRVAGEDRRLRVIHLTELPAGWLGKNHALQRGAREATGEYLLFTDADIVMEETAVRRAVRYAREHRLDHLAAFFRIVMPTWLLESFVVLFTMYFFAYFKPWKVRDPRHPAHVGVGGFNLLRREFYWQIGGHEPIALRPDDDVKLGKLVKLQGGRQDVVVAADQMVVPWYSSLGELIRGLEKNAFAGLDYNILLSVFAGLYVLVMHFGPFVAVFFTAGWVRWLLVAVIGMLLALSVGAARQGRMRWSVSFGFPLSVLLFVFILWRTMVLNLWQGGIGWRGTFYSLDQLRANRI